MGFAVQHVAQALVKQGHVLAGRGFGDGQPVDLTEHRQILEILLHIMSQLAPGEGCRVTPPHKGMVQNRIENWGGLLAQIVRKTHGFLLSRVSRIGYGPHCTLLRSCKDRGGGIGALLKAGNT